MKLFAIFAVVFCLAAVVRASGYGGGAGAPASGGYGGGSGGAVSIPAPPCPKNYLFSCVPNLSPAPCAPAAAGGHGGAGAYSHQYPIYSYPQYINGYQTNQDEN